MMRLRPWNFALLAVCWHLSSCQRAPQRLVLVEFEQADRIHEGTEVKYRGVVVGRVESVTLNEAQKKPLARVVLKTDAPPLTTEDEFHIVFGSLLGDPSIDVIPADHPGAPLANGASVQARNPREMKKGTDKLVRMLDQFSVIADLQELPEAKRLEVLAKMRKLIDEAKAESVAK